MPYTERAASIPTTTTAAVIYFITFIYILQELCNCFKINLKMTNVLVVTSGMRRDFYFDPKKKVIK